MNRISKFLLIGTASVFGVGLIGGVGYLILVSAGTRIGEEFCPDDFSRRQFKQITIPGLNIEIQPLTFSEINDPVAEQIHLRGILPAVADDDRQWHLIKEQAVSNDSSLYDARILCDLLDERQQDGVRYWAQWTAQHPRLAPYLWTHVSKLAKDYMYWAILDLMKLARNADDRDQLEMEGNGYLAQVYFEQGERLYRDKDYQAALQMLDRSVAYEPLKPAYESRAKIHKQLGELEKSAEDLNKAQELSKSD